MTNLQPGTLSRYPWPWARGRGPTPEELPRHQGAAAAQAQEGWEELLHIQGQEGRPWEDTPRPR